MGPTEKAAWTLVMFILLGLELRTLHLDRNEHDREQAHAECEQIERFGKIADQLELSIETNRGEFNATMKQFSLDEGERQKQFKATMQEFSKNEDANQTRFDKLFDHEEQLSEAQTGILFPANEPTPANNCQLPLAPGAVLVMLGNEEQHNAAVLLKLPGVVLDNSGAGIKLSVVRGKGKSIGILLDMRSSDGKLIARMNEEGYVINRNNTLEIKKDRSTLRVVDLYGENVLDVAYLNPTTISVKGKNIGLPKGMRFICIEGVGTIYGVAPE
jgi:hypothetical protein